ncbi:Rubrerythrin [Tritrichomonas foetus]|uniref:Rubrerythrin n=1 Tax=Tritrichomonas foetus TaxID=1144522 RepID=A0A1J4JYK1_9EUKA|nr:Rubrerythrin [Tritrichomonas foetus]|eukprot:OHT03770.1 Rubrerythrin [Tritrichomonas foetus]
MSQSPPATAAPVQISLKGSRTEKNLAAAYAHESMARNKYTYFASRAKKDGYEQISAIFLETAENEREHAKKFLKLMKGDGSQVHVQFQVPGFSIQNTLENLKSSAEGELEEHSQMYPHMAAIAEQEGFDEIAKTFRAIACVEREHQMRFLLLAKQVETGTVFKRNREVSWKCRNCGNVVVGFEAPAECPVCGHAQSYYEMKEVLE